MIEDKVLIEELAGLEKQRLEVTAQLQKIEGAQVMCRHLLSRSAQAQPQESVEAVNGVPVRT